MRGIPMPLPSRTSQGATMLEQSPYADSYKDFKSWLAIALTTSLRLQNYEGFVSKRDTGMKKVKKNDDDTSKSIIIGRTSCVVYPILLNSNPKVT